MKPRLLRSELTGQVYVVTRYKVDPKSGLIQAQTKYDVTDEFNALARGPMVPCGPCAGTGEFPPTGGDQCSYCSGMGEVPSNQTMFVGSSDD